MAYTKVTWQSEDSEGFNPDIAPALNAENLNRMEDGIEEAVNKIQFDTLVLEEGENIVSLGFKPQFVHAISDDGNYSFSIFPNTKSTFRKITDDGFSVFGNYNLSTDNISTVFDVSNGAYYFKYDENSNSFVSSNSGNNSTTAKTILTSKQDIAISFTYGYDTEGADKFTITVAGLEILSGGGTGNAEKSYSGSLKKGDTIVFEYKKDSSVHKGKDQCYFKNLKCTFYPTGNWSYMVIK